MADFSISRFHAVSLLAVVSYVMDCDNDYPGIFNGYCIFKDGVPFLYVHNLLYSSDVRRLLYFMPSSGFNCKSLSVREMFKVSVDGVSFNVLVRRTPQLFDEPEYCNDDDEHSYYYNLFSAYFGECVWSRLSYNCYVDDSISPRVAICSL